MEILSERERQRVRGRERKSWDKRGKYRIWKAERERKREIIVSLFSMKLSMK